MAFVFSAFDIHLRLAILITWCRHTLKCAKTDASHDKQLMTIEVFLVVQLNGFYNYSRLNKNKLSSELANQSINQPANQRINQLIKQNVFITRR